MLLLFSCGSLFSPLDVFHPSAIVFFLRVFPDVVVSFPVEFLDEFRRSSNCHFVFRYDDFFEEESLCAERFRLFHAFRYRFLLGPYGFAYGLFSVLSCDGDEGFVEFVFFFSRSEKRFSVLFFMFSCSLMSSSSIFCFCMIC